MTVDIDNNDKDNNNCNDDDATINNKQEINSNAISESDDDVLVFDEIILDEKERNLGFCFEIVLKEAVKEDRLVKQVCYAMLSAYTSNPSNLTINAPSGEGKTHVLKKVSDLFPDEDVQFIADMSPKAIFHKKGYLGIKNEDGDYENIESQLYDLKDTLESKQIEFKKLGNEGITNKNDLKREIDEIQKQDYCNSGQSSKGYRSKSQDLDLP